jgi:hypothetical protein
MLIFTTAVEVCLETIVTSNGIFHWGKLGVCFNDRDLESTLSVETKNIFYSREEGFVGSIW